MIPVMPPMTNVTMNPTTNSSGVFHTGRPTHSRRQPGEDLDAGRHADGDAGGGEEAGHDRRQADGEHVVRPQGERHEADGDEGGDEPRVAGDLAAGEHRHDHRHRPGRREELDVHLGVTEDPEQVLPQQRAAAGLRIEELPAEAAAELEQQAADDERGEGEHDHERGDEHRPGEQRHARQGHPGGAELEDADDDLDARGDGGDLGHAEPEDPEVERQVGREPGQAQRRVGEPAGIGHPLEQRAAVVEEPAHQVGEEAVGAEAGERHLAACRAGTAASRWRSPR